MPGFTLNRDDTGVPVAAYDPAEDMLKVKSLQKKWRSDFLGSALDPEKWEVIQTGAGQSVTVASSRLTIAAGTTANAETIIQSREAFTIPVRALFGLNVSQRIANQEFIIEFVSVDTETGVADGDSAAAIVYDATTATNFKYEVQYGMANRLRSGAVTIAVSSATDHISEIELFPDEAWFHQRYMDSTSGRSNSFMRHQQIPDPNKLYKIRIRAKNLGTAPASNTNFNIQFVTVIDYAELTAEITAGRGNIVAGQSVGSYITGGSITAYYAYNRIAWYTDSVTNLAANATYTGTSRDLGSTGLYGKIRAEAFASHAGTLIIEMSRDGTNWREVQSVAVAAGIAVFVEIPVYMRYFRVKYTNGATAQTAFELTSCLVAL